MQSLGKNQKRLAPGLPAWRSAFGTQRREPNFPGNYPISESWILCPTRDSRTIPSAGYWLFQDQTARLICARLGKKPQPLIVLATRNSNSRTFRTRLLRPRPPGNMIQRPGGLIENGGLLTHPACVKRSPNFEAIASQSRPCALNNTVPICFEPDCMQI